MGGRTSGAGATHPGALCRSGSDSGSSAGAVARVGLSVMDPVIVIAAAIILMVEIYIRLL
jgi:hypothetical protein